MVAWYHVKFFECCLSLEKDPDVLVDITSLLHRLEKGWRDSVVNSLCKNKTRKEMRMNVHIVDYKIDSAILVLGSDVSILKK